jgi:hypothetical protein
MTISTEANGNVVSLKAYRSHRDRPEIQPISGEFWESDGTDRRSSLADGCFLAALNIITWGPFIWALHTVTTAP